MKKVYTCYPNYKKSNWAIFFTPENISSFRTFDSNNDIEIFFKGGESYILYPDYKSNIEDIKLELINLIKYNFDYAFKYFYLLDK